MKRRITAMRAIVTSLTAVTLLAASVPAIAGWVASDANPASSFSTSVWDSPMYSWGWGRSGRTGVLGLAAYETTALRTIGLERWTEVAAGRYSTCGLTDDGHAYCWGENWTGQLGVGDLAHHYEAVQVGSDIWSSIAHGSSTVCAIKTADSILWCWGANGDGQMGDATISGEVVSPTPVSTTGLSTWSSVSIGESYVCGIKTDGSLWCWGDNTWGQLGLGDTVDVALPSLVSAGPWLTVGAGFGSSCAIKSADQSLWCWGYGAYGQVGDGSATDQAAPVSVSGGGTWSAVAPGQDHTCGLKTDGTIWCWGLGDYGMLGTNDTAEEWEPAPVAGGINDWTSLATMQYGSCARRAAGTLYCWGHNNLGQFGDGTTDDRLTPTQSGSSSSWTTDLAGGWEHLCGIRTDQSIWCQGSDMSSQFGHDWDWKVSSPTPLDPPNTQWATGSTGWEGGCAIKTDATLWCWGVNSEGSVGTGDLTMRPFPTMVAGDTDWRSVSVGSDAACAIKTDDSLWCWGHAEDGQLGVPTVPETVNTPAAGPAGTWQSVSVGNRHTCGITGAGALYCWGMNFSGQLGTGFGPDSAVPVEVTVAGVTSWTSVSAGMEFTCAIAATEAAVGSLYCWGDSTYGQVGNGTSGNVEHLPVRVDTAEWDQVVVGASTTCGIQADDSLWCWGKNNYGQLGIGGMADTPEYVDSPVQVSPGTSWQTLALGDKFGCAVKPDTTVWCWGIGEYGQLGARDGANSTSPQQIPLLTAGWLGAHGNTSTILAK